MEELTEVPKYTVRFEPLTDEERRLANAGEWDRLIKLVLDRQDAPESPPASPEGTDTTTPEKPPESP